MNRPTSPGIRSIQSWCKEAGISDISSWRFRKKGWLVTINIAGRVYITDEAIEDFKRRAAAGEFAKIHTVPSRGGAS